jgi:Leucine-rich repeat (LRR) protein
MNYVRLGRQAWTSLVCIFAIGCFGNDHQLVVVSAVDNDNTLPDDSSVLTPSEILLKVYDETRGMRWDKHDNWLQNTDVCTWYRVTCYDETSTTDQRRVGHVQRLDLSGNRLLGTLPLEVFQLPYIESIDVRDNPDLDMSFLAIAEAQYLKEIAISSTSIKNLDGIQAATQLQQLHMTSLGLTGSIPTQIFQLTSLTGLFANYNKFSGHLSSAISNLRALEEIYLFGSDISGQIPSELGLLTNLKVATLAENSFSGTLPPELNSLTSLQTFAINRAAGLEKGSGITGRLPSFSRLRDITDLRLQDQRLSGSIPTDFLSSAPKDEIIKVELSGNAITGTVPTSLTTLKRLNLFLEDNQISSVPETVCNAAIDDWMGGNVGVLGCDGFLCRPGFSSQLGRASTGNLCVACDGIPYWGSTRCESSTSTTSMGYSEREVLISLFNRMGGRYWKNDGGWLDPAVPICQWYGVECTGDKVTGLILKNNDLSNSPPESLFSLPDLTHIDFESNAIDFPFKGIARAAKLESLLLNSCDLSSLDDVGGLSQTAIRRLQLSSSFLHGTLPVELFSIVTLEELDISHNRLVGTVPDSLGAMTNLEFFSFSKNGLSGQIPTSIGGMIRLKYLLGFENSFSGTLPGSLGSLTRLESISFHQTASAKGIGGALPAFTNLGQLTSLQLGGNKLEGPLPDDFLRNTQVDEIEVRLSDNQFDGEIPESWVSRFRSLNLDLSGNRISGISSSICSSNSDWNQGTVKTFGCSGILCAPGTFNEFGMQTGSEEVCRPCSHAPSVQYYGAKACDDSENMSIQETSELRFLMEFFDSANGNNWKNKAGWLTSNDPCNGWYGVDCNTDGKVVSIELESNGLKGTPSSDFFKLPMLRYLSLKSNQLAFSFEGIAQASSLSVLILSETNLDSVDGISKATALTELHLTDNMIAGSMPDEILQLSNLRKLYLNYNQISGAIPPQISVSPNAKSFHLCLVSLLTILLLLLSMLKGLINLEELYLFNNRLEGQLPASIGLLTQLKELSLAENSFSGTLPPELNDLTDLEVLSIQREGGTEDSNVGISQGINSNVGGRITGALPPLDRLKYIRKLYFGSQSLSGTIPYNFLNGIENKDLSIEIDLISNRLTGSVPPSLSQFGDLSLFLAGNRISGISDGLCTKGSWMQGGVGTFQCNALLCPSGTYNSRGRQKDSSSPCAPCPSDTFAEYYGSFACIGEQQVQSLSERSILERFFTAMGGEAWNQQAGWLDSGKSICAWTGVTCVDGQESVSSIRLAGNHLMGSVPGELFLLPNLSGVDLSRNTINVSLHDINKAEKLEYLQLDGTGLRNLSGLELATRLKLLHLAENNFLGVDLAYVVASLTGLESLDVSRNDISVMPALKGHGNVTFLACAACGLTGGIPPWLSDLTRLRHIDFESNSFSGSIPALLSNLQEITFLSFADQVSNGGPGLSGSLPDFARMTQLQELRLQGNNLTSSIPESFLRDVNNDGTVTVDLTGNSIQGAIPQALSHIANMNLYLAGNKIDSVPEEICATNWNQFNGTTSDCSRILCAPTTFNALGRATPEMPCIDCTEPDYAAYYGSVQCGPAFEKNSVYSLFEALGGSSWTHADGWQDRDDHCSWYGVTCYEGGFRDGFVQAIDLSENNLHGTLSESVWKLPHMKELDLRKNEILVKFDGIGNANSLETLHLSETTVTTMEGISAAPNLQYLHLTNCDLFGKFDVASKYSRLIICLDIHLICRQHNSVQDISLTNCSK